MKASLFSTASLVLALALASTPAARAETLTLAVDPELSSITLSGFVEFSGTKVPLKEQMPNSLTANYAGTIPVEVGGGSIQFLGGAAIRALEPNDWQPGIGGVNGSAKASYGAKATATIIIFTVNAVAASRNLILDATSAILPLSAGKFAGGDIGFKFVDTANTTIDFRASGAINEQGTKILSGLLTNNVAALGTFEGPAGGETLTIPVDSKFIFEAETDDGSKVKFELTFKGQFVAKRGGVVQEPVVGFVPPSTGGAPISLNWSKSYKLQRATILNPPNWTDVNADSPITIPPIQPGEYFRVVKKNP